MSPAASAQARFADLARTGGRGALVTVLEGPQPGARLFVDADGVREGTLGSEQLDREAVAHADELMWAERSEQREAAGATLFVDVVAPAPRLVVFGAVDFAAALCTLARTSGWRPYVVDPRARFATRERFPDAEDVIVAWPSEAFAQLGGIDRAMSIAVLTHDPKLDDAALLIALRSPAPYVGAMGSRRAQERRRARLVAAGLAEEELDRLAAPIGLDLGALTPEETALSILAEVVACRRGREGGRLSHAAGRIHEVGT
jgi:xanthine dehydrogenase accessory factor